jgi:hypothetical protein
MFSPGSLSGDTVVLAEALASEFAEPAVGLTVF